MIQTDGSTALTQVGNNFFLDNTGSGSGPELQYKGVAVTVGEFGTTTPIGAVQVAGGGYDVAWKDPVSGLYTAWSTDSNGNYLSNLIGTVSGTSTALEALETTFNQDLNGDGQIGIPKVVIQTDGSTALTQVGNNYLPRQHRQRQRPRAAIQGRRRHRRRVRHHYADRRGAGRRRRL